MGYNIKYDISLFSIFCILFLCCSQCFAADHTVSGTTTSSIQSTIDSASNGDTILFTR